MMRHQIRTAVAAAAAAFVLLAGAATAAPAPDEQYRALTANIAHRSLETVLDQARRWQPDVIGLQEVCAHQIAELRAALPGWRVEFSPLTQRHPRCGYAPKGQALAAPELRHVETRRIGGDLRTNVGRKTFTLLCGTTAHHRRACVTHLRAGGTREDRRARRAQTRRVTDVMGRDRRHGWVLLGDLNVGPAAPQLERMRRLGWVEADRRHNEATHHGTRKLDHVWFRGATAGGYSGGVVEQPTSDHDVLRGRVNLARS